IVGTEYPVERWVRFQCAFKQIMRKGETGVHAS
ncbi:hypothetical protein D037_1722B, partial [Vibrio parahaemolyticus IDH02640]